MGNDWYYGLLSFIHAEMFWHTKGKFRNTKQSWVFLIDHYAKDGWPGEVWLLCNFYHESLHTWIKTTVNKFAISNHTVLISSEHALRSYLKLICEHELHSLPNKKVSGTKDYGKNYIRVRPPLVCHLLRNCLFRYFLECVKTFLSV